MAKKKKYKKFGDYKEVENKRNKKKKLAIVLSLFLGLIVLLVFIDFIFPRMVLERQLDDVHPFIPCDMSLYEKSDVLMVIPIFDNYSIAKDASWCRKILALNKTLGMHGVYHTYEEFGSSKNLDYIKLGMEEFKKCFGFYPEIFEAPQLELNAGNERLVKRLGLEVRKYSYSLFHKVYHCSDTGKFSNRFVSWI